MKTVSSLNELAELAKTSGKKKIAVAGGQDPFTIESVAKAVNEGLAEVVLIGDTPVINSVCHDNGVDPYLFEIFHEPDPVAASDYAVELVRSGDADILMKGLVGTDIFLKAVMHKEKGLLPAGSIMTYVCALEIPKYNKLLYMSDPAVLPFPDLKQKTAMINYSVTMARRLGVDNPKVALVSCTEKINPGIPNTLIDAELCDMNQRGQIDNCVVDGPLDIFLSCDLSSGQIKGVSTPIGGEADVLIFPGLEASNSFYKGLMLFAEAELAGLIQGTTKPVIVISRSESAKSKFYCIALACLMADT